MSRSNSIRNSILTVLFIIWVQSPLILLGLGFETAAKVDTLIFLVCGILFMVAMVTKIEFEEQRKGVK